MIRLLVISFFVASLTGCSEFQVIGRAALNELQSDAINVEQAAYQHRGEQEETQMTVAKADAPMQRMANNEGQPRQKGLWEH